MNMSNQKCLHMKNIEMKHILTSDVWIATGILFSTIIFIAPPDLFFFDLLQSFAFQALFFYGMAAMLMLMLRKWIFVTAFLGAAFLLLAYLQGHVYTNMGDKNNAQTADLKVAHFNVFVANTQYEKTLEKALATEADLLSFQEVHTHWATFLEKHLAEKYPYYYMVPGDGSGEGIAVFARYPLCNLKTIYWEDRPNIAGDMEVADSSVHFLASHTISPMNLQRYHQRKRHIQQITQYLQQQEQPVLAIGDYNIVPWNRQIVELKKQGQLSDSRKGRQATFPSYLGRWGIPIDYIFHSDELNCLNFGTIQGTGSDHLGVQGAYQLKKKNS